MTAAPPSAPAAAAAWDRHVTTVLAALPDVLACLADVLVTNTPRPLLSRPQWADPGWLWLEEVAGAQTERGRIHLDYLTRDRHSRAGRTWRRLRAAQRGLGLTTDPRIETPEPVGPPIALGAG